MKTIIIIAFTALASFSNFSDISESNESVKIEEELIKDIDCAEWAFDAAEIFLDAGFSESVAGCVGNVTIANCMGQNGGDIADCVNFLDQLEVAFDEVFGL